MLYCILYLLEILFVLEMISTDVVSDYLLDLLILPCSVLFQVNGSSRITVSISTNSSSELSTVSRDHIILSVVIQE
jgi:hypothetical protein